MRPIKAILAEKTDEQLRYYVTYVEKHNDEAVMAALAELQKRNVELPENINEIVASKLEERAKVNTTEKKYWDKFMVKDDSSPKFYSQRVIYIFSILFSVFFGSFLLATNLKTIGKPSLLVVLYGLAYFLLTLVLGEYIQIGFLFPFIANSIGVMIMQSLFWDRLIGKETKYNAKAIWKPLIIGVLISITLLMIAIYAN